jgi:predicted transcriptional regulator
MGRVAQEGLKLVDAAAMLQLSYRKVKRMWRRYQQVGRQGMKHAHAGRLSNTGAAGWAEVEMKLNDALARNWSCGYTLGMKTAISIPNDLFDGAERLARRTRRSRSRLFTDALREYLVRHAPDKVTESMDQAIMEVGEGKDEFVSSVARRRLERTEW